MGRGAPASPLGDSVGVTVDAARRVAQTADKVKPWNARVFSLVDGDAESGLAAVDSALELEIREALAPMLERALSRLAGVVNPTGQPFGGTFLSRGCDGTWSDGACVARAPLPACGAATANAPLYDPRFERLFQPLIACDADASDSSRACTDQDHGTGLDEPATGGGDTARPIDLGVVVAVATGDDAGCSGGRLVSSSVCSRSNIDGRPTLIRADLCPAFLAGREPANGGFKSGGSPGVDAEWAPLLRGPGGTAGRLDALVAGVVRAAMGGSPALAVVTSADGRRRVEASGVRDAARAQWGCATLSGAPVAPGVDESVGPSWSAAFAGTDELLAVPSGASHGRAASSLRARPSGVTVAALGDTGWYSPIVDAARNDGAPSFPAGGGCAAAAAPCATGTAGGGDGLLCPLDGGLAAGDTAAAGAAAGRDAGLAHGACAAAPLPGGGYVGPDSLCAADAAGAILPPSVDDAATDGAGRCGDPYGDSADEGRQLQIYGPGGRALPLAATADPDGENVWSAALSGGSLPWRSACVAVRCRAFEDGTYDATSGGDPGIEVRVAGTNKWRSCPSGVDDAGGGAASGGSGGSILDLAGGALVGLSSGALACPPWDAAAGRDAADPAAGLLPSALCPSLACRRSDAFGSGDDCGGPLLGGRCEPLDGATGLPGHLPGGRLAAAPGAGRCLCHLGRAGDRCQFWDDGESGRRVDAVVARPASYGPSAAQQAGNSLRLPSSAPPRAAPRRAAPPPARPSICCEILLHRVPCAPCSWSSVASSAGVHWVRAMRGSRCRVQRPMHCWSVRPAIRRAISAHRLACWATRRASAASSSAVHLSLRMSGLTLCRQRWAHCCPVRPGMARATTLHRLPCCCWCRARSSSSASSHAPVCGGGRRGGGRGRGRVGRGGASGPGAARRRPARGGGVRGERPPSPSA